MCVCIHMHTEMIPAQCGAQGKTACMGSPFLSYGTQLLWEVKALTHWTWRDGWWPEQAKSHPNQWAGGWAKLQPRSLCLVLRGPPKRGARGGCPDSCPTGMALHACICGFYQKRERLRQSSYIQHIVSFEYIYSSMMVWGL